MAEAVTARWHGDNYQARVFWENALNLFVPNSCVVEVTFEANGPKAFDDIVVKYDPAVARSGSEKVTAEYHQVKWHVEYGGRFGYADFVDPAFIGAQSVSLLERLRDAKKEAPQGARFAFLTTYRVRDDDPLGKLISGTDKTLLLSKLFDGTGDRSRMGKVRKLWREHLGLKSDEELRPIVAGLRVLEGHRSLDELRSEINFRAHAVGLLTCHASDSDFRFDELARQLKVRQINALSRALLEELCRDERLYADVAPQPKAALPIAIRSFLGPAADIVGAADENTLLLTDAFTERYLQAGRDWQDDIRPRVEDFLHDAVRKSSSIRLILDAHASIAFLAGAVLDLKSGTDIDLVQKGRVGTRIWRADEGEEGPPLTEARETIGAGRDIALLLGVTHDVGAQALHYVSAKLPQVGQILRFGPGAQAGQRSVAGGRHAADLADQITRVVRAARQDPDGIVHIFAACPNALLFYLGQQHQGVAPAIVYEFDFDRRGDKTYHPSFLID